MGEKMTALIQLTLDGSLVHEGHRVSMRVLGNSMTALQAAADRAYLDIRFGNVWKHQRLRSLERPEADFLVGDPREGSYIIGFLSEQGQAIVQRLRKAIKEPYTEALQGGDDQIYSINNQITARKDALANKIIKPQEYQKFLERPDALATRTYGDKSINKEFNQMLTPIRRDEDASLKLALKPSEEEGTETFEFNYITAHAFKRVIAHRQLGNPVIYTGKLRQLDRGHNQKSNFKGKFINKDNDKDIIVHIQSEEDFLKLVPFMNGEEFQLIACPVIEYSSFDQVAGDIQFINLL